MKNFKLMAAMAMAATVIFTSCKRQDTPPQLIDGVEKGTEFTAGIQLNTCPITVSDEIVGAGKEPITGTNSILGEDATVAIQIKNDKDGLIARGYYKLFVNKKINPIFDNLKVTLKHGYDYSVEATIINNPDTQCSLDLKGYTESPIAIDDSNQEVMTTADDFISENTLEKEFGGLNLSSYRNKGLRYYCKFNHGANYPVKEGGEEIIYIDLKCKSFKTTYKFENMPLDSHHSLKLQGGERQESYNCDKTSFDEWYELTNIATGTEESWAKIYTALIGNSEGSPILKEFTKTGDLKFSPAHHYTITTDFGIEAGVSISVDTYILTEEDPIDMNKTETEQQL